MKSTFFRQFALTAGMILLSFLLLGCSFIGLFYSFVVREQKNNLKNSADAVADYVSSCVSDYDNMDSLMSYDFYYLSLSFGAALSSTDALLCNTRGEVVFSSTSTGYREHMDAQLDSDFLTQIQEAGGVYKTGTLPNVYDDNRYIYGKTITTSTGNTLFGYVIVSASSADISATMASIFEYFVLTALLVLLIALVACLILTRRQTEALREMSAAARQFAHGDFSARINPEGAGNEVAELAVAFNNMADSLQRSESLRQEFISNVSHELKTPMTTIAGFMDGMLDGTIPPEKHNQYMRTVADEVRRLSRLVRSMLEISRLRATGEEVEKTKFDVTETLGRVLLTFEQKIDAKHLDVSVNMPDRAVYVRSNEDSVTQVIYNLIDNGVKFAEDGTAFTLTVEPNGGKALVSVQDIGQTIPPDELPLVFDRFHKSDKSRSLDKDGAGLGLYIVKTILGNLGEDISVTSDSGRTTFTFTLCLCR